MREGQGKAEGSGETQKGQWLESLGAGLQGSGMLLWFIAYAQWWNHSLYRDGSRLRAESSLPVAVLFVFVCQFFVGHRSLPRLNASAFARAGRLVVGLAVASALTVGFAAFIAATHLVSHSEFTTFLGLAGVGIYVGSRLLGVGLALPRDAFGRRFYRGLFGFSVLWSMLLSSRDAQRDLRRIGEENARAQPRPLTFVGGKTLFEQYRPGLALPPEHPAEEKRGSPGAP